MWEHLSRECLGSKAVAAYGRGQSGMNQDKVTNGSDDGDANHEEVKQCSTHPLPSDSYEVGLS